LLGTLALGLLGSLSGCDTTKSFLEVPTSAGPEVAPSRVVAQWQRTLVTAPDFVNNGRAVPCIAGCIYLIGPDGETPVAGDGELVVSLLHDVPRAGTTGPVEVAHWKFDAATMKKMLINDRVGPCYPVILPWPERMPVFSRVELKLRYQQANQVPVYEVCQPFTMDSPQAQTQTVTAGVRPRGR
jgi:hypothetical protein